MGSLQERLASRQSPKVRANAEPDAVADALARADDIEVFVLFGGDAELARGTLKRDGHELAFHLNSSVDKRHASKGTGVSMCIPTVDGLSVFPTQILAYTHDPEILYLKYPRLVIGSDYRNSVRLPVGDPSKLNIEIVDGGTPCEVVDVSVAGVQIEVDDEKSLRPGDVCQLKVRHANHETLRQAEVRWARGTRRGLTFLAKAS